MGVKFSRCNKANLNNVPIVDGQIVSVKDSEDLYIDHGTVRTKISDIIFLTTKQELDNITNPLENKLYFVFKESKMYAYNSTTGWVSVGGGAATSTTYDNTESKMTATNVQDAIDELSDLMGYVSTELHNING